MGVGTPRRAEQLSRRAAAVLLPRLTRRVSLWASCDQPACVCLLPPCFLVCRSRQVAAPLNRFPHLGSWVELGLELDSLASKLQIPSSEMM